MLTTREKNTTQFHSGVRNTRYDISTEELGELWKIISESTLSFIKDRISEGRPSDRITNHNLLGKYYRYCEKYNIKPESTRKFWIDFNKHINENFSNAKHYQDSKTGNKGWEGIKVE